MPPALTALPQAGVSPVQLPQQQYNLPDSLSPLTSPQGSPKPIGTQAVLKGLLPQLSLLGLPVTIEDASLATLCQLPSPDDRPVQCKQPKPERVMHLGSMQHLQPWQQQRQQQRQGLQQLHNEYYRHLHVQCWESPRISNSSSHSSSGSAQARNYTRGWSFEPSSGGCNSMRDCQAQRCNGLVPSAPVVMPQQAQGTFASGMNSRSICGNNSACGSCSISQCTGGPRRSSTCSSANTSWAGTIPGSTVSCCSSLTDSEPGWCTDTAHGLWPAAPFDRARSNSCGTCSCHIKYDATADGRVASTQGDSAGTAHRRQRGSHSRHNYEANSRTETQQPCSITSSRASSRSSTPAERSQHCKQLAVLNTMPLHLLVVALEQRHAPTCGSRELLVQRLAALLQEQETTAAAAAASSLLQPAASPTPHTPEATAWPAAAVRARSSVPRATEAASSSAAGPLCAQTAASLPCALPPAAAAAAHLRVFWVEFQHEGVKYRFKRKTPVCSRCGSGGHGVWQCSFQYCASCKAYGHAKGPACATACERCGRRHAHKQQCKVQQCSKCRLFGHQVINCPRMRCCRCGCYGHATGLCSPAFAGEAAEQNTRHYTDENITAAAQDGVLQSGKLQKAGMQIDEQLPHADVAAEAQGSAAASCHQT